MRKFIDDLKQTVEKCKEEYRKDLLSAKTNHQAKAAQEYFEDLIMSYENRIANLECHAKNGSGK